jgi:hypothetical protein
VVLLLGSANKQLKVAFVGKKLEWLGYSVMPMIYNIPLFFLPFFFFFFPEINNGTILI